MTKPIILKSYDVRCCECDGPCDLNTEYDGSAVCSDKNCKVHEEQQQELKATLMSQMKSISKQSAIESILFLIALHDISLKDIQQELEKKLKTIKGK